MNNEFWHHPAVVMTGYFSVVVLCLVVAMAIFEAVTRYKNWYEIKNGNMAVAFATGGKIIGICNIFRYSIERHNSLLEMIGWGMFGFFLLIVAYLLYEFFTPTFKIDEEIEKGNLSVGLSFVIGASIS